MRNGFVGPHVKISTGIAGLDDMLGGGLLPGRPYLLIGPPGSGKTTTALQFLLKGIRQGEEVLYVTLEDPPNELRMDFRHFPKELDRMWVFDAIPDVMRYEKAPFKDIATVRSAQRLGDIALSMRQTDEFRSVEIAMTALMQALKMETVKRLYGRIVIDSLTALKYFGMKGFDDIVGAQVFLRFLSDLKITAIVTMEEGPSERAPPELLIARGEFHLYSWEADGLTMRAIGVEKFRGSPHDRYLHPYRITSHGVEIDPTVSIARGTSHLLATPPEVEAMVRKPSETELQLEAEWAMLTLLDDVSELAELGIDAEPVRHLLQKAHANLSEMKLEDSFKILLEARQMVNHLILTHQVSEEFKEKGGRLPALKRTMEAEPTPVAPNLSGAPRADIRTLLPLLSRMVAMLGTKQGKSVSENLPPKLLERVAKTMLVGGGPPRPPVPAATPSVPGSPTSTSTPSLPTAKPPVAPSLAPPKPAHSPAGVSPPPSRPGGLTPPPRVPLGTPPPTRPPSRPPGVVPVGTPARPPGSPPPSRPPSVTPPGLRPPQGRPPGYPPRPSAPGVVPGITRPPSPSVPSSSPPKPTPVRNGPPPTSPPPPVRETPPPPKVPTVPLPPPVEKEPEPEPLTPPVEKETVTAQPEPTVEPVTPPPVETPPSEIPLTSAPEVVPAVAEAEARKEEVAPVSVPVEEKGVPAVPPVSPEAERPTPSEPETLPETPKTVLPTLPETGPAPSEPETLPETPKTAPPSLPETEPVPPTPVVEEEAPRTPEVTEPTEAPSLPLPETKPIEPETTPLPVSETKVPEVAPPPPSIPVSPAPEPEVAPAPEKLAEVAPPAPLIQASPAPEPEVAPAPEKLAEVAPPAPLIQASPAPEPEVVPAPEKLAEVAPSEPATAATPAETVAPETKAVPEPAPIQPEEAPSAPLPSPSLPEPSPVTPEIAPPSEAPTTAPSLSGPGTVEEKAPGETPTVTKPRVRRTAKKAAGEPGALKPRKPRARKTAEAPPAAGALISAVPADPAVLPGTAPAFPPVTGTEVPAEGAPKRTTHRKAAAGTAKPRTPRPRKKKTEDPAGNADPQTTLEEPKTAPDAPPGDPPATSEEKSAEVKGDEANASPVSSPETSPVQSPPVPGEGSAPEGGESPKEVNDGPQ